jgi:hypothetical protein
MRQMKAVRLLFDRTAVLFLGVAAGVAIGYAFGIKQQIEVPGVAPPPQLPVADANAGTQPDMVMLNGKPAPPPPHPPTVGTPPAGPPVVAETRPIQPGIVGAIAAGRPVRVGVFGDSFGDGVWTALYNQLNRKAGYQILKFSQQATGFTRYRTLNLEEHDRDRLAPAPVDIAVISFGANDMMGVASGGHVYALLTPNWQAEIGRRVSSYVAMLRAQGAIVYWVGLPKMRDAAYDADVVRMNAFYRQLMGQLGVPFIETAPYSVDADGQYAAYLPDPVTARPVLMRANDGIHMSVNGYIRITRGLAGRIRSYVDRAREAAGKGSETPPPAPAFVQPETPRPPAASRPPKPTFKLEDPLADEPRPAKDTPPPAPKHTPAGKGAPIDLLPPGMQSEPVDGNTSG